MKKVISCILLFSFPLYILSGCAAPQQTQLSKTKERPSVQNLPKVFSYSKNDVYKASIASIQQKNFIISLSDPYTGIVTGDYSTSLLLPEEEAAFAKDNNNFATTCITVLGILLLFGIIAALVNSNDSSSNGSSSSNYEHSYDDHSSSDSRVHAYKYSLSVFMKALDEQTTEVNLQLIKMNLENGTIVSQVEIQNEQFNENFYILMEKSLNK